MTYLISVGGIIISQMIPPILILKNEKEHECIRRTESIPLDNPASMEISRSCPPSKSPDFRTGGCFLMIEESKTPRLPGNPVLHPALFFVNSKHFLAVNIHRYPF